MTEQRTARVLAAFLSVALTVAACGGGDSSIDGATPVADDQSTEVNATDADGTDGAKSGGDVAAEPEPNADPTEEKPPTEPSAGFDGITETVQAFVDSRRLDGASLIIVHRDDGVVYEEYFGEFEPGRVSLIASSSKMISAGVLLRLQEDGVLELSTPVADQAGWAVGNPEITPAQLISNSSGLVGLGPDLRYAPYLCQWQVEGTLTECGTQVFTTADDDGDQVAPDTTFRYGGAQWQVAGALAESVSGRSWETLIDEIYIQPCGVDSLGYLSFGALRTTNGYPGGFDGDPDGVASTENPNIEGGGYISMTDYAELMLMHLRAGECNGTTVLSQDSLDLMHADRIAQAYDGEALGPDFGYGMGWWVDRETGRLSDGGAFGTVPWLDLEHGYGAYIVIEDRSATGQALRDQIEDLVHAAVTEES